MRRAWTLSSFLECVKIDFFSDCWESALQSRYVFADLLSYLLLIGEGFSVICGFSFRSWLVSRFPMYRLLVMRPDFPLYLTQLRREAKDLPQARTFATRSSPRLCKRTDIVPRSGNCRNSWPSHLTHCRNSKLGIDHGFCNVYLTTCFINENKKYVCVYVQERFLTRETVRHTECQKSSPADVTDPPVLLYYISSIL